MPLVDVPCPNCGAKLKAPDNMAGKKAKCKKCGKVFRIPGAAPSADTVGDGQAVPVLALPAPGDETEVLMAEPVAELPLPAAPAPASPVALTSAKDISALPSADPFDFSKPAKAAQPPVAPAAPVATPAGTGAGKGGAGATPVPAAKPAAGSPKAPSASKLPPVAPKAAAPAPAAPAPVAKAPAAIPPAAAKTPPGAVPAAVAKTPPAAVPAAVAKAPPAQAKSAPKAKAPVEPLPPEEIPSDNPPPAAKAKPAEPAAPSSPAADNPFAFTADTGEKPAKSNRRKDEDEDERPKKKRRQDDEEAEDRPAKSRKRKDEDEEDEEDRPKKKRRKDDENEDEADRPAKSRKRKDDEEGEEDRPKNKKKGDDKREQEYNPLPEPVSPPPPPTAAPVPAGSNPFSFTALTAAPTDEKSRRHKDEDEDRPKNKRRDQDEADEDERPKKKRRDQNEADGTDEEDKPRYQRPREKGGMGKAVLITGAIGLLALALGIAALVAFVSNKRKQEQEQSKKEEKKEEPSIPSTPSGPPGPGETPTPKVDPKKEKDPPPKKDKDPDPKTPKNPEPPAPSTRPTIALPRTLRAFAVGLPPAKPTVTDPRQNDLPVLDVPIASVRRVFPPFDPKTGDTRVLVQVAPAAGGKSERLALETYGAAGNRVPTERIEYDGDGLNVPLADLLATANGTYFLAAVGGKLHVWSVGGGEVVKKEDGLNPYADKPEHAKAGLAAAFFSPDPTQVFTISTAGGVLLYDLRLRKAVAEYNPPDGAPGKVALGQSVAKSDGNGSVAVAVAGVLYQIEGKTELNVVRKYDLGGDVGRSIALAVSGTPGQLLYVFETAPDKSGKKETAILGLPLGDTPKPIFYQFPSPTAGEPKAALWINGDIGGVVTDRGVVWFEDHEGKFLPLVFTQPATTALYFGDEKNFWYVVPHTMPNKSAVVAVRADFNDRTDFMKNYTANQPLRIVRIDTAGLSK
jgi:hypothetical protein